MKPTILLAISIACVWHAENQTPVETAKPNGGYVKDEYAAKQIGKTVMRLLLTPDDLKRKQFSDAVLKDGVWIVRYWEVKTRINFPVVIHIRQKSGAIIKFEDPNA